MTITDKTIKKTLPKAPGIYLFKDKEGQVIYIGKAKSIHKRVLSYFQKQHKDWKILSLLEEHDDIDYILTKNETEALLLEAQLISDNKPKYNVLLTSGQPFLYILFTKKEPIEVVLVRNKKEKGIYFGPFLQKYHARRAYDYLMRTFKLFKCNKKIANGCLDYHIGLCAGTCKSEFELNDYAFRVQLALDALKSSHREFLKKIKEKIELYNHNFEFEKSRNLHSYIENVDVIFETLRTKFYETKYKDEAFAAITPVKSMEKNYEEVAHQLQQLLKLDKPPIRIDCFDISHFQSKHIVGSCVRFSLGKPDKNSFRKFNIKTLTEQNDYAALQEIITRRYRDPLEIPDLVLIDGGKGQLNAACAVLNGPEIISLAKREETVFSAKIPEGIKLDNKDSAAQLLLALRDYAHHFAISHHRVRRRKGQMYEHGKIY
jgi:excinuclease ABC subunit C